MQCLIPPDRDTLHARQLGRRLSSTFAVSQGRGAAADHSHHFDDGIDNPHWSSLSGCWTKDGHHHVELAVFLEGIM